VARILLVEDEPGLVMTLTDRLASEGYDVEDVGNFDSALRLATDGHFDAILLDVMLPGGNGFDICRTLRQRGIQTPILMLTARGQVVDRVVGLKLGADDYLVKPFSPRELLARIRALLRRAQAQATVADAIARVRAYRFGGWELNVGLRRLKAADGRGVELTNGEFSLLAAFVSAPGRVLSRDRLLDLSRLHSAEVYDRSIDVQILRLRRKIEADPARPQFIRTQRGAGYVFDAVVEAVR
jgi:two-component system, OmpR family, response regulator